MSLTIGADPELFCQNAKGEIVMGIGLIGGTKETPKLVTLGAVQEDNVLAEFNIDPAKNPDQFVRNINTVTAELDKILAVSGLTSVVKTSHNFEKEVLMSGGDQALRFGCDPDLDCWTNKTNEPPNPYTTLRTAGGHVHIGYDNPTEARSLEVACILEYLLGVPSVLLDDDTDRRSMYGQSGSCRIKPYGVEYRVLSNFWLKTDDLKRWVFNTTALILNLELKQLENLADRGLVRAIIDGSDKAGAQDLVHHLLQNVEGFYMPKVGE